MRPCAALPCAALCCVVSSPSGDGTSGCPVCDTRVICVASKEAGIAIV